MVLRCAHCFFSGFPACTLPGSFVGLRRLQWVLATRVCDGLLHDNSRYFFGGEGVDVSRRSRVGAVVGSFLATSESA